MLKVEYVDTNPDTGYTDIKLEYCPLGKSEVTSQVLMFSDRWSAVAYIRSCIDDYFKVNVERYYKACPNLHELYHERWGDNKKKAFSVIERYHKYLLTDRNKYPESLQFYLRIRTEFRRILPRKDNPYYRQLAKQVEIFDQIAQEFYLEFASNSSQLMLKYQPQHTAQAS